jgi:hydrogenase maturation protein HypF
MKIHEFPILLNPPTPLLKGGVLLALGAESAGNFSVFYNVKIYYSDDFGDLLDDNNFKKYQNAVLNFLKKNKLKPGIILTDLHPLYKTTLWGEELAKKYKAKHIQVQHHIAHIFSAVGEDTIFNFQFSNNFQFSISKQISNSKFQIPNSFFGIALDGTGYGLDGKIWGGEAFAVSNFQFPISKQIINPKSQIPNKFKIQNSKFKILRIGHLENQTMIGADLAVKEPARMLIAILNKIPPLTKGPPAIASEALRAGARGIYSSQAAETLKNKKKFIYNFVKKYYTRNQFELLYNQLQHNFNCQKTSSTGRVLDAASLLLGFCGNERNYKHEPIDRLEKNSTKPYKLPPLIKGDRGIFTLQTTPLFEYLIKNLRRDKRRLAATAQLYIAKGLHQIILKSNILNLKSKIFLAGGISNNKIISSYFESKGFYVHPVKSGKAGPPPAEFNGASKKIYSVKSKFNGVPRGDAGISFGQVIYYLSIKKE